MWRGMWRTGCLQRNGRPYTLAETGILLWRESLSISGETMAGGDLG